MMKNSILLLLILLLTSCGQPSNPNKYQSQDVDSTLDECELQDSLDFESNDSVVLVCPDSLKVGQVWLWVTNQNNPFEDKKYCYQRIISIKNGYVQYVENGTDTMSSRIGLFVVNISRVK